MALRTSQLGHSTHFAAGTWDLFTVPAGQTWIVKDVVVANTGSGTVTIELDVTTSDSLCKPWLFHQALGGGGAFHWTGFFVMEPGDVLTQSMLDGQWFVIVSGSKLMGTI